MTLDIRTLNPAEMEQAETIAYQAFGNSERHNMTAALARARRDYRPAWYLGAFEDGEMTLLCRDTYRMRFFDITPDAFSWTWERRAGDVWELAWAIAYTRLG